jgi:hypothetical protein
VNNAGNNGKACHLNNNRNTSSNTRKKNHPAETPDRATPLKNKRHTSKNTRTDNHLAKTPGKATPLKNKRHTGKNTRIQNHLAETPGKATPLKNKRHTSNNIVTGELNANNIIKACLLKTEMLPKVNTCKTGKAGRA